MQTFLMHIQRNYKGWYLGMCVYLVSNITALKDVDFFQWICVAFLLLAAIVYGAELIGKFFKMIGKPLKWKKNRETDHDLILKNSEAIKTLADLHKKDCDNATANSNKLREDLNVFMSDVRNDIKTFTENRVHDREQSRDIQKELLSNIQSISAKVDAMQRNTDERFAASEEKQNQRVQSDIKERIAKSYRRYSVDKKITRMELESLEDLIATYESHGGDNSFVHSVVQKEMYTWEVKDTFE